MLTSLLILITAYLPSPRSLASLGFLLPLPLILSNSLTQKFISTFNSSYLSLLNSVRGRFQDICPYPLAIFFFFFCEGVFKSVLDQCPCRDVLIALGDFGIVTGTERGGYMLCVCPMALVWLESLSYCAYCCFIAPFCKWQVSLLEGVVHVIPRYFRGLQFSMVQVAVLSAPDVFVAT
ncbi:hypothetical protein E2C01_040856 [Portunus trituberculatus]|uniref:Uncharacterized protein n=1 Tax=Portunus trituberculatus TaxID=210409 RepID=A0A5B7FII0_PORTR|nr:hypothetical protein [Portunus trituberculatus]